MRMINTLKTTILLAALTALLVLIGRWLGGTSGMVLAFALALLMNSAAYWFSDKLALTMAGAREVMLAEAPALYRMIADLARQAGLPMPRVYVIEADAPNAFATGRNPRHAAVAVTTGLMDLLDRDELAGVIAHELAHIKNRDTLISAVAATIAGAVTTIAEMAQWALMLGGLGGNDEEEGGGVAGLAWGLLMIVLAPIAATLIQLAISRTREFRADAAGAQISGDPLALAAALRKLDTWSRRLPLAASPATAHMYIVNPLHGSAVAGLFSTHPSTAERIARLERMALNYQVAA